LATEVNPVGKLSSTLWAEHDLASRVRIISNIEYAFSRARVPSSTPGPQLTGLRGFSVGLIWERIPFETLVIPAKAGIQSVDSAFPKVCRVDSRFRGNDCDLQRPCLANDTSTEAFFPTVKKIHPWEFNFGVKSPSS
jgi:hypothetical protein